METASTAFEEAEEAQAAAVDAERALAAQPVPTWLSDMETHELRVVSDAAAALFGFAALVVVAAVIALGPPLRGEE